MARPLKPFIRGGGGYYPSAKYTPLVYPGGYTTMNAAYGPLNTFTGSIVRFKSLKEFPVMGLTANIDPVQNLNGYDAPWPAGGGKNILKLENKTVTSSGVTAVVDSNGFVTINGTANANAYLNIGTISTPAETLVFSSSQDDRRAYLYASGETTVYPNNSFTGGVDRTLYILVNRGETVSNKQYKLQIESGSTATAWSPYENICPISGWTGANVTRTGKNLFDKTTAQAGYIDNSDGQQKGQTASLAYKCTDYIPVFGGMSVYVNTEQTASIWGAWYDKNKTFVSGVTNYANRAITAPATANYLRLTIGRSDNGNVDSFAVNYPSTTTTYEPYTGTTIPITFPTEAGTVYGGTLDVTDGVLTVDRAMMDLGDLTWTYTTDDAFAGSPYFSTGYVANKKAGSSNMVCSQYSVGVSRGSIQDCVIAPWNSTNSPSLACRDDRFTDAATFKTAMSGVQLVYELAAPQTYQLTPQEVTTLIGENTIWADTGDVSVTAYGEPILTAQANTLLGFGLLNTAAVVKPESDSVEEPTEEADEQG